MRESEKNLLFAVEVNDSWIGTATKFGNRCLREQKPVGKKNPKAGKC
jgi:hypothetical protein